MSVRLSGKVVGSLLGFGGSPLERLGAFRVGWGNYVRKGGVVNLCV
jgi:hypothetical protein